MFWWYKKNGSISLKNLHCKNISTCVQIRNSKSMHSENNYLPVSTTPFI